MISPTPRRVGLALCAVQFFFALSWTVYVIFLPQLAAQAGLPKSAVIYILMADQLVFLFADYAVGVAADRSARVVGRLGPAILGLTLLSCAAFLLLPFVAPQGSAFALFGLTLLWAVTSSALRAPPLALVGRYVDAPAQPWLVALSLFGLGLASAMAPYLGMALRDVDPRWPFVLSSLALAVATLAIVSAERALASSAGAAVRQDRADPGPTAHTTRPAVAWWAAALLAAAAFQLHVFLNSPLLYRRHVGADQLPQLVPVFWIGFNLVLLPASLAARRYGVVAVMGVSAGVAALASAVAHQTHSLVTLVVAQWVAGGAWACLLMSAFAAALAIGRSGREGRFSGALSSLLALAALLRMAVLAAEWPRSGNADAVLNWAPSVGWMVAATLLLMALRHAARRGATGS